MASGSDNQGGAKAANLIQLESLGVRVPKFVVLNDGQDAIVRKVKGLPYPLIIRSSSSVEDQADASFAGVFNSAKAETADRLAAAYATVKRRNEAARATVARYYNLTPEDIDLHYVVQHFMRSRFGGVMKVPRSKHGEIITEMGKSPESVTSGKETPETIALGSGAYDGWRNELKNAAEIIRDHFKGDQEVEWLCAEDGHIYIVQTRPIVNRRLNAAAVLAAERARLAATSLHAGYYETESLPDIAQPTPLTLELVQAIYARGLRANGLVSGDAQPVVIITGNAYLDKKCYRSKLPLVGHVSQMASLYGAYKLYRRGETRAPELQLQGDVGQMIEDISRRLAPLIFQNTNRLQLLQNLLSKKLGISPDHMALHETAQTVTDLDNEYELSVSRSSKAARKTVQRKHAAQIAGVKHARKELLDTLVSSIDAAYCSNMFKLYDFLVARRAALHMQLIDALGLMHRKLLALDAQHGTRNMIWYASFDEIKAGKLPKPAELQRRMDAWKMLQSAPLPHPNELDTWDDLVLVGVDKMADTIKGVVLSPGIVKGEVGKEISVVSALTQGLLVKKSLKGIITERGGALSHVAILAKELQVPILRVENATHKLTPGTKIILDSNDGIVSRL